LRECDTNYINYGNVVLGSTSESEFYSQSVVGEPLLCIIGQPTYTDKFEFFLYDLDNATAKQEADGRKQCYKLEVKGKLNWDGKTYTSICDDEEGWICVNEQDVSERKKCYGRQK